MAAANFLVRTAGHIIGEQQRLIRAGRWDDLHHDLAAFVEQRAELLGDHLDVTLEYLLATATNCKESTSQPTR